MQDLVSVIVPIYNVEQYLKRCVDSLLAQTYQNIEILLVDDCSTDHCAQIAKEYSEKNPGICRFIQREKNGGLSAARNTGMDASKGEWTAFVDSDDWVTEDYIESLYVIAQNDNADIVVNNSYYVFYNKDNYHAVHSAPSISTSSDWKDKIVDQRFFAVAKLFRKSFLEEQGIRFPEDIWRCEDISTIIPLFTRTNKISVIHKPTYYYFQRSNSLSNQNKNIDVSFYPMTIQRMIDLSSGGFEKELEFRAISEILYGMIMVMIRANKTNDELNSQVRSFEKKFPGWRENPYLHRLPRAKQVFISAAGKRQFALLRLFIFAWDVKLMIKG